MTARFAGLAEVRPRAGLLSFLVAVAPACADPKQTSDCVGPACTIMQSCAGICGGDCPPCADGVACVDDTDCVSGVCDQWCWPGHCADALVSADETDVDCGGSCWRCVTGSACNTGRDCDTGICADTCVQLSWSETQVTDRNGSTPQVGMDADGNVLVAWNDSDEFGATVVTRWYSAAIDSWGPPELAVATYEIFPVVYVTSLGPSGRGIMLWHIFGSPWIYARWYSAGAGWVENARIDGGGQVVRDMAVEWISWDDALAAWQETESDGSEVVRAALYNSSRGWSPTATLGVPPLDDGSSPYVNGYHPRIAANSSGQALVMWPRQYWTGSVNRYEIWACRYLLTEAEWGPVVMVQRLDGVVYDYDGGVALDGSQSVAWLQSAGDGGGIVRAATTLGHTDAWQPESPNAGIAQATRRLRVDHTLHVHVVSLALSGITATRLSRDLQQASAVAMSGLVYAYPNIGFDENDNATLAWVTDQGSIRAARYVADWAWEAPTQMRDGGSELTLAVELRGGAVLAWETNPGISVAILK